MALAHNAGNHAFGFTNGVCQKCGMTCEYLQDNGKPTCTGQKPKEPVRIPIDGE
jgi:hypothetical protein